MKRLFLFVFLCLALLAVAIGRTRTGSGALTAAESSAIAVSALAHHVEGYAQRYGVELPRPWLVKVCLRKILEPGAYLVTRLGVLPRSIPALAVVILASWWVWVAGARLVWSIVGGALGLTSVAHFHLWLRLGPPWRPFVRAWLRAARWWKQLRSKKGGTASWAGALTAMTLPFNPRDAVFIGCLWLGGFGFFQPIGIRGPRHITVVAAAGSGKTRWLIGWLGTLPKEASAFVVDCDGQMVNALGAAKQRAGHRVLNLDPYGLSRFPSACWNALDELAAAEARHGRKAVVRFAQTLAEALVPESNSHQPIFSESARVFIHGLILYVYVSEPPERRNLVRLRELLTRGMPELVIAPKQDPFDLLLRQMERSPLYEDDCDGKISAVVARAASVMKSGKGRDGNPFRSNAITATAWLDLPELEAISTRSDFVGEDLKSGNPFVFVVAPVTDIQNKLAGWIRAQTMMFAYAFQNIPGSREVPCAFAIDEMPSLGRMEILETAAPVFRKYGIRLVVITQDLERLKQAYPQSYGGFIGNSQATIWMGTDHQDTLEQLSKILGNTTATETIKSGLWSKIPDRIEKKEHPLMTPDQLRDFLDPERGQIIVTRSGKSPMKVAYRGYDKALPVWGFEQDKQFSEPFLRNCARRLLNFLWLRKPPQDGGGAS